MPTQLLRNLISGLFHSEDVGLDLGTANTLAYVRGRGIVVREPSVVAIDRRTGKVRAVGEEAKMMIGRTPSEIEAVRPLRHGVIADFDVTEAMVQYFVRRVHRRTRFVHPSMVVGIPCGCTEVEKRAVIDAALRAGARWARTIEEPMAAAIGAGLPVDEPVCSMVVDIGAGTTEVAAVSLGGMVHDQSLRIAGDEMDEAVISYVRREHSLLIGERTAEEIKIAIGSAFVLEQELVGEVKGRDLVTGLPRAARLTSKDIRAAIVEPLSAIVELVKSALESVPPELAADIVRRGICLTGGGALLRGIDHLLWTETEVPVYVAQDPMTCVVKGTGAILEELLPKHDGRL